MITTVSCVLRRLFCLGMSVLVLIATGCGTLEHRFLYDPDRSIFAWEQPRARQLAGLSLEDVTFPSLDGTRLHGWFVQPQGESPRQYLLFAHGRAGNIASFKKRLFEFVRRHQVAVFAFDYRGYGKSAGRPCEQGLYQDMTAARNWLAVRAQCETSEIVLMGHSLGAAVAIDIAAREGAKALIVESGFTSLADVLRHHTQNRFSGQHLRARFDSQSKIGTYAGPILISHGYRDRVVPYVHGVRLAEAAVNARSVQLIGYHGGHRTPPGPHYQAYLDDFLSKLP